MSEETTCPIIRQPNAGRRQGGYRVKKHHLDSILKDSYILIKK